MIQKTSLIAPADNCGVLKTNVFHVYKGGKGRLAFVGDFLKISVREISLESSIKKKSKHRSILVRTKFWVNRKDSSYISFENNSLVLLKKRLTPKGKIIKGPISWTIKRKKFVSSFSGAI